MSPEELYVYATKYTSAARSMFSARLKVRIVEALCGRHLQHIYGDGQSIYDPFAVASTFLAWAEKAQVAP